MLREREAGLSNVIMATVSLRNTVSDYEYIYIYICKLCFAVRKTWQDPNPAKTVSWKAATKQKALAFLIVHNIRWKRKQLRDYRPFFN